MLPFWTICSIFYLFVLKHFFLGQIYICSVNQYLKMMSWALSMTTLTLVLLKGRQSIAISIDSTSGLIIGDIYGVRDGWSGSGCDSVTRVSIDSGVLENSVNCHAQERWGFPPLSLLLVQLFILKMLVSITNVVLLYSVWGQVFLVLATFQCPPDTPYWKKIKLCATCSISESVIFHCIVMLCYYAWTMYLCYSHVSMMMEPPHAIIGKHYKRGFQLLVYHREYWLWIEYCYSVCPR